MLARTPFVYSRISDRLAVGSIGMSSAAAVAFLLWLLYVHRPPSGLAQQWNFLPPPNALLKGLSAIALCAGMYFIKHRNVPAHRVSMLAAFGFSSLFLVSYIVNHAIHGDTHFPGHGTAPTVYLSILSSHIVLSIVALPLALMSLFFALSNRFAIHRRPARVTFPIWLYVSVTGVVVFASLKTYVYWQLSEYANRVESTCRIWVLPHPSGSDSRSLQDELESWLQLSATKALTASHLQM
jgi:putative membrane protein